ncbi:hypothetical protein MSG28_004299 [Choristoneura fumiferana]|uniref:Uncharacterized protein n=1 Tax=Choristoneura fumiferana TaxID=7141 RepID=A0ACC0KJF7_CHOFU|nr:hypothetical protein MSG28_004299 [Choristoneura fumiferana]
MGGGSRSLSANRQIVSPKRKQLMCKVRRIPTTLKTVLCLTKADPAPTRIIIRLLTFNCLHAFREVVHPLIAQVTAVESPEMVLLNSKHVRTGCLHFLAE